MTSSQWLTRDVVRQKYLCHTKCIVISCYNMLYSSVDVLCNPYKPGFRLRKSMTYGF